MYISIACYAVLIAVYLCSCDCYDSISAITFV